MTPGNAGLDAPDCSCSRAPSGLTQPTAADLTLQTLESAVIRGLFPRDWERRRFLKAMGHTTALAALGSLLPQGALEALAQNPGKLERNKAKIGYVPITCCAPLIMARELNYYAEEGLEVELVKTAGWALMRDKVYNKELCAYHMLAPMPIAFSMGIGSSAQIMNVATLQNVNGQAITLSLKHRDRRDPRQWTGFVFGVPFEFSIHNFLLRYYVSEFGLDPDRDIQIRVMAPSEMVANLRAGNIDGFLGPDPFNQRAVYEEAGFIHLLTRELWDGHPCCSFGSHLEFVQESPNVFGALFRAGLRAAAYANAPSNRKSIADTLAPAHYLNQPQLVVEQALTGHYADGLGQVKDDPRRIAFEPFPWYSTATWILTQMKRWGYLKGDVNWKSLAEQIYLVTDARRHMKELGFPLPTGDGHPIRIMGKDFDADAPDAYVTSFPIRRT